MNITDALIGMKRLKNMGFCDEAIRIALSQKSYRTESEAIEAVGVEQARIDAETGNDPPLGSLPSERTGGHWVSSGKLSNYEISLAMACGRFFVNEHNLGWAWFPDNPESVSQELPACRHCGGYYIQPGGECPECGIQ